MSQQLGARMHFHTPDFPTYIRQFKIICNIVTPPASANLYAGGVVR